MTQSIQRVLLQSPLLRLLCFACALILLILPLLPLANRLAQLALGTLIFLALAWIWEKSFEPRGAGTYGLTLDVRWGMQWVLGLTAGFVAVGAVFATGLLMGVIVEARWANDIDALALLTPMATAVLVGIWEEGLFRGVVLQNLWESLSKTLSQSRALGLAIAISSILFAGAHSFTDNVSPAAIAFFVGNGAVWCFAAVRTERVALCAGMHSAWNFAQLNVFGFAMSGNASTSSALVPEISGSAWLTGGEYGPEGGVLGGVGLLVMFGLIALCTRSAGPSAGPSTGSSASPVLSQEQER